jgi:hypothetical protein
MQWYMFICYLDNEVSTMNCKNLMRDLSHLYRELYLRDGEFTPEFEILSKVISNIERHYYFAPKVSKLANDILDTYGAFPVSTPESIKNMRKIVL